MQHGFHLSLDDLVYTHHHSSIPEFLFPKLSNITHRLHSHPSPSPPAVATHTHKSHHALLFVW